MHWEARALPVMTYNIRIDMEERDANNHYTKRVGRLSSFIGRMEPWLIGLQEPSSGQLLHLQSGLASHWRAVGYEGNGHKDIDRADPRRFNDYQTGILYDSRHLELVESDHIWLSERPRSPGSKSWDSVGVRTVYDCCISFEGWWVGSEHRASEHSLGCLGCVGQNRASKVAPSTQQHLEPALFKCQHCFDGRFQHCKRSPTT